MQTLDRAQVDVIDEPRPVRTRNRLALTAVLLVILVVTAVAAYGVASSRTVTKTVVRGVPLPSNSAPAPAPLDERGFNKLDNGHQAEAPEFYQPVSPATRVVLQNQLTLAREAAMQYPTVKDAEAAGWRRAGPFSPGLGAHYFHFSTIDLIPSGTITDNDALHPASLIYDGTHPNSRIAGLMYYSAQAGIPEGFAGPNDVWHYHTNVCIVYGSGSAAINTPFGADTTVSKAMCDGVHGQLMAKTQWMLHAWVVPGYDSPEGVFSHDNAALTCRDGSYNTIPLDKIGNRSSVCADGGE